MHQFLKFIFGIKLYVFRKVPLSIIRSFSLYTQQWYMSYRFADSLRAGSGRNWSCSQAVLLCVQWKTADDGHMNCPKHVEFYSKDKFEQLVHLVGFIIRIHFRSLILSPYQTVNLSAHSQCTTPPPALPVSSPNSILPSPSSHWAFVPARKDSVPAPKAPFQKNFCFSKTPYVWNSVRRAMSVLWTANGQSTACTALCSTQPAQFQHTITLLSAVT